MSEPVLIGLGGHKRAGKDAVADYMGAAYGYEVMGMSDPLNEALLTLNPWIPLETGSFRGTMRYQELYERVGYVEAKEQSEVRRLLQLLGTEVGRNMVGEDVWVDIARKNILRSLEEGRSVILTALRFPNELEMIQSLGGLTAFIDRPAELRGVDSTSQHASETSVSPEQFDTVVKNDGPLERLYEAAHALHLKGVRLAKAGGVGPLTQAAFRGGVAALNAKRVGSYERIWPIYDN